MDVTSIEATISELRAQAVFHEREAQMFRKKGNQILYVARCKVATTMTRTATLIESLLECVRGDHDWANPEEVFYRRTCQTCGLDEPLKEADL